MNPKNELVQYGTRLSHVFHGGILTKGLPHDLPFKRVHALPGRHPAR